jgi:hypothetical protein
LCPRTHGFCASRLHHETSSAPSPKPKPRSARCRQREAPATRSAIGGPRGEDREQRPARSHRGAVQLSHAGARQQPVHAHTDRPVAIARACGACCTFGTRRCKRECTFGTNISCPFLFTTRTLGDMVVNIAPAHSLLYCSRRHADRKKWSASSTHQIRARQSKRGILSRKPDRACGHERTERVRNVWAQLSAQARAQCSSVLSAPCCRSSAGAWSLALAAPLHARARAQQRTRGQGHVAPEDNARPDAAAPPGRLGSCRWMGAARTPKNVQMMRKRKAAGLSSETTTKFS